MPLINLRELAKVGGQLSGVAGAGFQGYGTDKSDAIKESLQALQDQRAAKKAALDEMVTRKALGKVEPGEAGYADYNAGVQRAAIPVKVAEQQALTPGEVAKAGAIEGVKAPIEIATHRANRTTDLQTEPDKVVGGIGPNGVPLFARVGQTGAATPIAGLSPKGAGGGVSSLPAPLALRVGQFGEMLKKSNDLLPAMEAMDVSIEKAAASDVAQHGIKVPLLGVHIPGTQGMGASQLNKSPEYATYQAALTPFVLAAAHAMGGARINPEQVTQIRNSIEITPGESAQSRAQKNKNMIDLINSIGGSLPHDAISDQEGQMDEQSLTGLVGRGYKRVGTGSGGGSTTPKVGSREAAVAHLKAQGKSDAEILQTLGPP